MYRVYEIFSLFINGFFNHCNFKSNKWRVKTSTEMILFLHLLLIKTNKMLPLPQGKLSNIFSYWYSK